MPTALITGITGQDGSYLAELLLRKGYRVVGLRRRTSTRNEERIRHLPELEMEEGDLTDLASLVRALDRAQPDEVYNLAAQSFVGTSWRQPLATGDINGLGVTRLLEAIRTVNPAIRSHTVREFVELAFAHAGLDWKQDVVVDPELFRPAEVDLLVGDASRARRELGWRPKVSFSGLVAMMVDADLERLRAQVRGEAP